MTLYSSVYPSFTNSEIRNIEMKSGKEARYRINEYDKKIKSS
jgi:hypothetical protein